MVDILGPAYFLAEAVKARAKDLKNDGKTVEQAVDAVSVELYRVGRGEREVPLAEVRVPTYPTSLGPVEETPRQTLGHLGVRAVLALALEKVCPDVVEHLMMSKTSEKTERRRVLHELRNITRPWVDEAYGAG